MEKTLSKYGRRFDKTCSQWKNDKIQNRMTIRYYERYFVDLLSIRGYVFLRDIYELLGMHPTKESCTNGWWNNGHNSIVFELEELGGSDYKIHVKDEGSIIDHF